MSEKKTFVTLEQLKEIDKTYPTPVSYTHLRAHETRHELICHLLLEKR